MLELVAAAALVSLHETEKPELRMTLWGNLVFYTGGERMKEWNGAGDPKEPAGKRKVRMDRRKIHRKGIYYKEYYNCASQFLT